MRSHNRTREHHIWSDTWPLNDEPHTPEDACLQGRPVDIQEEAGTIEGMNSAGISSAIRLYPRSFADAELREEQTAE